jgi:GT2 family glycosyltransferase
LPALAGAEVTGSGENLGFGEGINRLVASSSARFLVIANPDLVLEPGCVAALVDDLEAHPDAVVAGGLLLDGQDRVNAYGQRLTADLLGVNTDRGALPASLGDDDSYLGPSGALFALARERWQERIGGPLFPRSLFLYLEDVALWIKLRRAGAGIRFCPRARALHAWSVSTGQRSARKLYFVERNRLWLSRALLGDAGALARMPFTALRYGAYLAQAGAAGPRESGLAKAFAGALRDGWLQPVPEDLRAYLPRGEAGALGGHFARLRDQLRNPVR